MNRHTNNSDTWYGNDDRVNMDISPLWRPFPQHILNESIGVVDPWLWSLQDRILTLPSSMMSFPRPRMQLVVFRNNVANNTNLRSRPTEQTRRQDYELTPHEQREAFGKLKREIYNPIPKKIVQRLGKFYRQNEASKAYGHESTDKEVDKDDDDDDKKCVICLEDFEAKEVVMVTPCYHMFHEDCILPWVKSHGKCPVCRFSIWEKKVERGASSTNNDNSILMPRYMM